MRKTDLHDVGGVLSADIAVPELERELEFYRTVLTTGDSPLWRGDLFNNLGTPVIGLGERTQEYDRLPLQWMPHFQVADVASSATRAVEMGGKELMSSTAGGGQNHWAVLVDPVGAAFGVIPVVDAESQSTGKNQIAGRISWLSLTVPDAATSRDFYQSVIGWNAKQLTDDGGNFASFEMLTGDNIATAEIIPQRSGDSGVHPVWVIHLPVGDLATSLQRVQDGGGEVIKAFAEEGYALVRDPVGVNLALRSV